MKNLFERYGLRRVRRKIRRVYRQWREERNFQKWIELDDQAKIENRATIPRKIENFARRPLISVLLPVYNVEEKWLRLAVESVLRQFYENWELCIADDCSTSPHIRRVLEECARHDERIKIVFRQTNGHISAASNSALELATGEFIALLDHDDELAENALFDIAETINDFPATDFIYSDEDMIDEQGARFNPKFKPDFSLDLLYSVNYATHLAVYRTEILKQIGGFRLGLEGSQDYDLALRVIERISEKNIRHIPKILYHWRAIRGSVALSGDEKPYAHERARQALKEHFERVGSAATINKTVYNLHRVRYRLPKITPKVSLILAAGEDFEFAEQAIENFVGQTDYPNFEIVLVSNSEKALAEISNLKSKHTPRAAASIATAAAAPLIKFVVGENANEAEQFNRAVAQTSGEILCFADANLKPLAKDWLKELSSFAVQTEIGAVGAKIINADETVLHAGLLIGTDGAVGSAHRGLAREDGGYLLRAQLVNNFSAVSVSCLMTRREVFESDGGFDAENFPGRFFDADYCLKLLVKNYRIVFTPYAELTKVNEKRRLNFEKNPTAEEKDYFVQKWKNFIERDPSYNPNLSKKSADFAIEV